MERKTRQAFETKVSDEGIVETIFAVMGNIDAGGDRIHPGAFAKTFAERGQKVKVLNHHNAQSINDIIGKPLELRELSTGELPPIVTQQYPDATGGAYAKIQLLMDTPEGEGAFKRIKAEAVDEWSFGYDALDKDFEQVKVDGKEVSVRNLRTLKLFEVSPVIWGMNSATTTLSAKEADADAPAEEPEPDEAAGDNEMNLADLEDRGLAFMGLIMAVAERANADEITWDDARTELTAIYDEYVYHEEKDTAPAGTEPVSQQAAQETQAETQAGPDGGDTPQPPTSEVLSRRIRLEQERLQLLEV